MVSPSDLLPDEAIRLGAPATDWQGALRAAGDLLVAAGSATDAYTEQMIRNVTDHGPYIVVAPGFAFAHARPSPAVRRTGMAWVRLSEPVVFGHETNDPVDLVVALAAEDPSQHTSAMAALARLLGDPDTEAALRRADTPQALRRVLERQDGHRARGGTGTGVHTLLTVCGNGVGTSLFLKSTVEQVLRRWGWERYVRVEATDTVSAKGKAGEAVAALTSREIARTLGDIGVPVQVVADFTSTRQADAALRDIYDV